MKSSLTSLLACAALFALSQPVLAADPPATDVTGHYYLQGVTEVGSELLLKKDGKFEWGLAYGAADMLANGTWTVSGKKVNLGASRPAGEPVFTLFSEEAFSELGMNEEKVPGQWKAAIGVPGQGGMADVEVRFEAKSGKSATAITSELGDASVQMSAKESWARAGLRAKGSKAEYQWFIIPAKRAREQIAGFTLTDPKWLGKQAFTTLSLDIVADGLKADPASMLSRGVYVKRSAN